MINKTMSIGEIIQIFPDSVEIMMGRGLHCVGCHVASWESLEEGCRGHGMSDELIDSLVKEINDKLEASKWFYIKKRDSIFYYLFFIVFYIKIIFRLYIPVLSP